MESYGYDLIWFDDWYPVVALHWHEMISLEHEVNAHRGIEQSRRDDIEAIGPPTAGGRPWLG